MQSTFIALWGFFGLVGALLLAVGAVVLIGTELRRLSPWMRGHRWWVLLGGTVVGIFGTVFVMSVAGGPRFGWCGLICVPVAIPWVKRMVWYLWVGALEESALPFFHVFLGFLRAGIAVPHALVRSIDAAPGAFSQWLHDRLLRREKGETLVLALARVSHTLPAGGARSVLESVGLLYDRGLGVVGLLDRQVAWISRQQTRTRKIRSLQGSLMIQALASAALPWCLFAFSVASNVEGIRTDALWESFGWQVGLVGCGVWQCLGLYFLTRLGRFF